ncbi:MAG: TIGR02147 family protein [Bdellovibrionaceae bacterium]|nr:TIGR02147 family protein [Bdellovibrio sp.]
MPLTKPKNNDLQNYLRKLMQDSFEAMKVQDARFSLRSFAKRLSVSPTAVSEMLNGKRVITKKTADKICEKLNLTALDIEKISKLLKGKKTFDSDQKSYLKLDVNNYPMFSEWHYFAILSLAETDDFTDEPAWIAKRFNLPVETVQKALTTMEDLKVLARDPKGMLRPTGVSFQMTCTKENLFFKKAQNNNLEMATKFIEKSSLEQFFDFSSMTLFVDNELLPEAKELIINFRRKLAEFLESGKREEVYKLNIQLFPLSHPIDK